MGREGKPVKENKRENKELGKVSSERERSVAGDGGE